MCALFGRGLGRGVGGEGVSGGWGGGWWWWCWGCGRGLGMLGEEGVLAVCWRCWCVGTRRVLGMLGGGGGGVGDVLGVLGGRASSTTPADPTEALLFGLGGGVGSVWGVWEGDESVGGLGRVLLGVGGDVQACFVFRHENWPVGYCHCQNDEKSSLIDFRSSSTMCVDQPCPSINHVTQPWFSTTFVKHISQGCFSTMPPYNGWKMRSRLAFAMDGSARIVVLRNDYYIRTIAVNINCCNILCAMCSSSVHIVVIFLYVFLNTRG